MKTAAQRIETADTIELVPQILHLKKILVTTDFHSIQRRAVALIAITNVIGYVFGFFGAVIWNRLNR